MPWYKRQFHVGRPVDLEVVMAFSQQMGSFIEAGIPMVEALEIARQETSSERMEATIRDIIDAVERGTSFTAAVGQHADVFPAFYRAMLRSADYTGSLDEVLTQAASYLERDISARKQIKSALTYPIVVVCVAVVAIIAMSVFVLPRFASLYRSVHARLPLPTRMLLAFTDFVSGYWWLIAAAVLLVGLAGYGVVGGERNKARRDRTLLRLPVLGGLVQLVIVERFCRVLAALTKAGVPLPEGIGVAANSTNNSIFSAKIADVREALMRGAGLSEPLRASEMFPNTALQMISVGERTGALGTQLSRAAAYYEREVTMRIKKVTDLFEPAVILAVGLMVAFVAIAQVSAMYSVFSQIK